MTVELEEQFFKVFGIEPIPLELYGCWLVKGQIENGMVYPEITDRKLLEMICILSGWRFNDVQDLEETILEDCIKTAKRLSLNSVFANQIQQLFKEAE